MTYRLLNFLGLLGFVLIGSFGASKHTPMQIADTFLLLFVVLMAPIVAFYFRFFFSRMMAARYQSADKRIKPYRFPVIRIFAVWAKVFSGGAYEEWDKVLILYVLAGISLIGAFIYLLPLI